MNPDYVVPSGWLAHAPFAFWLVDTLRPKVFVELGTHTGFSFFVVTQAVREFFQRAMSDNPARLPRDR